MNKKTLIIVTASLGLAFVIWGLSMYFTQSETARWSDATKDSLGNNKIALEHIRQLQEDNAFLVKTISDCKQIIDLYSQQNKEQRKTIDSLNVKLEQCRHGIEIRQ